MNDPSAEISCQRHLFDIPDDVAYLNCAYYGPMLKSTSERLIEGALSKTRPWNRQTADFFDDAESCRVAAAAALGGDAECYAIVPSASYALTTVARIMEERLGPGDEILLIDEAFPSNYLPWQRTAEITKAKMRIVPTPPDFAWTTAVLDTISSKTAVVAIPNYHWTNGAHFDLAQISDAVRSVGAALVIDATQSLGAVPLDFDRIRPDFCIAAGYKWLLFPYGLGLFYVDSKWHSARPLEETWQVRRGSDNFADLSDYSHDYQDGARRFDVGEKCAPSLLPGGVDALWQIGLWGVPRIAATLRSINSRIAEAMSDLPYEALPEDLRSPNILGYSIEGHLPDDLLRGLAARNVYVSVRRSSMRIAPHLHVNDNDIDRLVSAMRA